MKNKLITGGILAAFLTTTGLAGVAAAQSTDVQASLAEDKAIELALAEVAGEVQEIELEDEDGVPVYEIEILTADGEEFEVEIDGNTGEVLEVEAEDMDDDDDEDEDEDDDA